MTTVASETDNPRRVRADRKWSWVVEEVEWFLRNTTAGATEMSEVLRIRRETLRRALCEPNRLNRPDLWHRLRDRDVLAGRILTTEAEWDATSARLRGQMA